MPLKPHRDRITFREIQDEAGRGDIFPANFLSIIVHLSAFLAHLSANQNLLAEDSFLVQIPRIEGFKSSCGGGI